MVSFQCEACGDVFTKKKLDSHRSRCRDASFTCIDCMVHFQGTDYRSHTSCMTEAQKYQGALYKEKEKPTKQPPPEITNRSTADSNQDSSSNDHNRRRPYVEDAPDIDDPNGKVPPPSVPSPPTATTSSSSTTGTGTDDSEVKVSVFDFLVGEATPNASSISLGGPREQMKMVDHAPSVFEPSRALARLDTDLDDEEKEYDIAYEENGFSYGAEPIKPSLYPNQLPNVSMEFVTPVPRKGKDRNHRNKTRTSPDRVQKTSANQTSDKKRKRGNVEEPAVASSGDMPMVDGPSTVVNQPITPSLNHSGLTGGLSRMLRDERSPSAEYVSCSDDEEQRRYQDPQSPIKRTRRNEKGRINDSARGISIKGHAERIKAMFGGSTLSASSSSVSEPPSKALVQARRTSADGDRKPRPVIQVRRYKKSPRMRYISNGEVRSSDPRRPKRKIVTQANGYSFYEPPRPSQRPKAIEYHRDSDRSHSRSPRGDGYYRNDDRQLVIYQNLNGVSEFQRQKADHFLSLVTKGPESRRGCSVHKALKRFHRDFPSLASSEDRDIGRGRNHDERERRVEEEQALWRALRLKRNDRGEIVVFL